MPPKVKATQAKAASPGQRGQRTLLQFFTPKSTASSSTDSPDAGLSTARSSQLTDVHAGGSTGGASCSLHMSPQVRDALLAPVDWSAVAGEILFDNQGEANVEEEVVVAHGGQDACDAREDRRTDEDSRDVCLAAFLGLDQADGAQDTPEPEQSRPRSVRSFDFADEDSEERAPLLARLAQAFTTSPESSRSSGHTQTTRAAPLPTTTTASAAATVSRPAPQLKQTFLDFGQSTLAVGTTCPRCGMLYAALDEDIAVHRRVCAALATHRTAHASGMSESTLRTTVRLTAGLDATPTVSRKRERTDNSDAPLLTTTTTISGSSGGETIHPLLSSEVAVELLELLTREPKSRAKRSGTATLAAAAAAATRDANAALCVRVAGTASDTLAAYVLRGDHASLTTSAPALRLVEALGCLDVVEAALAYRVVFVVDARLRRVVAIAAGRAAVREQDPELVLTTRPDGSTACSTQQRFTFCDVDCIWCAPVSALVSVDLTQTRASVSRGLNAAKDSLQRLFHAKEEITRERDAAAERARETRSRALATALRTLTQHVVYGQTLHVKEHCSYARDVCGADAACDDASLGRGELSRVLSTFTTDEAAATCEWFEHRTHAVDNEEDEEDEEGQWRCCLSQELSVNSVIDVAEVGVSARESRAQISL